VAGAEGPEYGYLHEEGLHAFHCQIEGGSGLPANHVTLIHYRINDESILLRLHGTNQGSDVVTIIQDRWKSDQVLYLLLLHHDQTPHSKAS
jgi:hypothetical protein